MNWTQTFYAAEFVSFLLLENFGYSLITVVIVTQVIIFIKARVVKTAILIFVVVCVWRLGSGHAKEKQ